MGRLIAYNLRSDPMKQPAKALILAGSTLLGLGLAFGAVRAQSPSLGGAVDAIPAQPASTQVWGEHAMRRHGRGAEMMRRFDANDDGAITQAEIDNLRTEKFQQYNGDGNETLNLEEYEQLWLDWMRERMVDRFQHLDADGDGEVTVEEYERPTHRLIERLDRNGDGQLSREDRRVRHRGHTRHRGWGEDDRLMRAEDSETAATPMQPPPPPPSDEAIDGALEESME